MEKLSRRDATKAKMIERAGRKQRPNEPQAVNKWAKEMRWSQLKR